MAKTLKRGEDRLWEMIAQRAQAADPAEIDQRIWDLYGESWSVMFTDLSGFSRQVEAFGILHFLQLIWEHKQLLEPVIHTHDGVLVKQEADSLLILFRRPQSALRCAFAMQALLERENERRSPETKVLLCVGIGYGPVLRLGDDDVYGAEVNAASKLGEDTARAREILITRAARDALIDTVGLRFEVLDAVIPGSTENFRVHLGA